MKKVFILLFNILVLCGCNNFNYSKSTDTSNDSLEISYNITNDYNDISIKTVIVNEHKYVVATIYKSTGAGISMIHSESCDCKKDKYD